MKPESDAAGLLSETDFNDVLLLLPFGVAIFDHNFRLQVANDAYRSLLELPSRVVPLGTSLTEMVSIMTARGEFVGHVAEELARQRMHKILEGIPTSIERARPSGRWVEVRLLPRPQGGSLHVYCDITEKVERRWRAEGMIVDLKARARALEEALLSHKR